MKKVISLTLALLMLLSLTVLVSCGETEDTDNTEAPEGTSPWDSALYKENATLGTGSKTFTLEVCAYDKSITLTISSSAETLGEALLALNLLEGEDSTYGLYVKKVNGILADHDIDQTYWALYIDNEYAMTGVDSTPLKNGQAYKLSREK